MPLCWIYRGPWSDFDRFQELTEAQADRAESEGWGQRCANRDGRDMMPIDRAPHAAADAFYNSRMFGSRNLPPDDESDTPPPAPMLPAEVAGGSFYDTREMRAEPPMKRGPGRPRKNGP